MGAVDAMTSSPAIRADALDAEGGSSCATRRVRYRLYRYTLRRVTASRMGGGDDACSARCVSPLATAVHFPASVVCPERYAPSEVFNQFSRCLSDRLLARRLRARAPTRGAPASAHAWGLGEAGGST